MMRNKVLVLSCCSGSGLFPGRRFPGGSSRGGAQGRPSGGDRQISRRPYTEEGAKYLGLAKADAFTLKDVKAPYVLVEQFNTSCPHCMHQAPVMNELFDKVQADPQLKAKLKFIGVGQGNEETQVKMWKAFQRCPLPWCPTPTTPVARP